MTPDSRAGMDSFDPPLRPPTAPQLRTLLLTDLCDSTQLVERMGDGPAAELFREHDRLVLQLQQQWRGRLIDRSDGLLLLFERPIDGLGFALDYVQGLRTLGQSRKLKLQARAGLHVGEVLTWRNSDEAVRVGAKPLEVEGLAKPMAGRLMAMARPGQILLSAVAEPLAHRAARELGERGQLLLWTSHGRWRFKGVPEPQQIYEVGEPGLAPLRAPPNSPKAWRDVPLWRRPVALMAECALIAGIGIGAWFVTRPQPAIAFQERDWVVVGDVRNLTGEAVLDDSLEQAMRISLEQSRYVNVIGDLKARDTLARMQLKPATPLDRAVASEVALRIGARAVILPTVAEVGGRLRVSAEIVDPRTQATVHANSADGVGLDSALSSIDEVTAALREQFGEAVQSIEKDSRPLPEVTTADLDALRAYALAQKAYAEIRYDEALELYAQATREDPKFALAWVGTARTLYALQRYADGLPALHQAQAVRERLPAREALYLDGWTAQFEAPDQVLAKWQLLARLYPDFLAGAANVAIELINENRFDQALPFAERATSPHYDQAGPAWDRVGRIQLGREHYVEAAAAFERALSMQHGSSLRRRADVAAVRREFLEAGQWLARTPADDVFPYHERISIAIDRGDFDAARAHVERALRLTDNPTLRRVLELNQGHVDWLQGDHKAARRHAQIVAEQALDAAAGKTLADVVEELHVAFAAAILDQRLGGKAVADRVLAAYHDQPQLRNTTGVHALARVLRANQLRLTGHPTDAVEELKPLLVGHERYQVRVALLEAYAAAGDTPRALDQVKWLQSHRGRAYIEQGGYQVLQAFNVADSTLAHLRAAEILRADGRLADAGRSLAAFDRAWAPERLAPALRFRRDAVQTESPRKP